MVESMRRGRFLQICRFHFSDNNKVDRADKMYKLRPLTDVAVQNVWILYRKTGHNMNQLDFRRHIVQVSIPKYLCYKIFLEICIFWSYLTRFRNGPSQGGRPSTYGDDKQHVPASIKQDGLDRFVIPVPEGKRKRCAGLQYSGRGRTIGSKCQVF